MPVILMKCISSKPHPDADALFIYEFEAPEVGTKQIVANLENTYAPNDLAFVALEGTILKDGTKIKPAKIRGVSSYGMALSKYDHVILDYDPKPGDDWSHKFCDVQREIDTDGFSMILWPNIESLYNVRRWLTDDDLKKVRYRPKVKLDGTNAAVQVLPDGRIAAQSRSRIITPKKDNLGFADWVYSNQSYFKNLAIDKPIIIFGEWAGSGIQKRTAISQIDRKIFAVFAVQVGNIDAEFVIEPAEIVSLLQLPGHQDVFVLPWHGPEMVCNYANRLELQETADAINKMVDAIEKTDPFVQSVFKIDGLGEGVVMYPLPEEGTRISRNDYTNLVFKAKGEAHKVVKTKKPAQIDPELARNIDEFVKLFVTEPRLEQGVTVACNGEYDMRHIGTFLKWFANDVKKESEAELEVAGLEFKQVSKRLASAAKDWYVEKVKSV